MSLEVGSLVSLGEKGYLTPCQSRDNAVGVVMGTEGDSSRVYLFGSPSVDGTVLEVSVQNPRLTYSFEAEAVNSIMDAFDF